MRSIAMRKIKDYFFFFLMTTFLGSGLTIGAQELGDVEVITQKVQEVYITRYGYVVSYATSDIYRDNLFLPREWFLKENTDIYADQKVTYLNIDVPLLKVTYVDSQLKYVTLFIPKSYAQLVFPAYEGPLEDAQLKEKFDAQLLQNTLTIK